MNKIIMIILCLLSRSFSQAVILIGSIFTTSSNRKKDFINKLISFKKINSIYFSREEKLSYLYGNNNMSFEDYCNYLSSKSKNRYEKKFLKELKECENKICIDRLIDSYLSIYQEKSLHLEIVYLLHLFVCFFFSNVLPYFNDFSILLNISNMLLLLVLLISYHTADFNFSSLSFFDRFYCLFYRRLSYMTPMKSMSLTLEDFKRKKKNIYQTIYQDVNNKTIKSYSPDYQKEMLSGYIYQILYVNKFKNESPLVDYYRKVNSKNLSSLEKIGDLIYLVSLLVVIIFGVVL